MRTVNFEKVKKVKQSKIFTLVDVVLLAVIVLIIGLSVWLIYLKPRGDSLTVTVTAPDYKYVGLLSDDNTIELEHICVHIQGGKVWVTGADCSDKICERTGEISRAGQSIVCLPNNVVVSISGDGDLQWGVG